MSQLAPGETPPHQPLPQPAVDTSWRPNAVPTRSGPRLPLNPFPPPPPLRQLRARCFASAQPSLNFVNCVDKAHEGKTFK
jgi:hypothetical protein